MASKATKRAAKKAAKMAALASKQVEETKVTPVPTEEPAQKEVKEPETPAVSTAEKPAEKPKEGKEKSAQKAPETKQEKKEEVKPQSSQSKEPVKTDKPKKEPKIPTLKAEEVTEGVPSNIQNTRSLVSAVRKNEFDGRIDANHSIDLMGALERRYLAPGAEAPENLKKAMSTQYDVMLYLNLNRWNEQTKQDFGEAGVTVNEEVFAAMQQSLAEAFGITLKALPQKEGADPSQLEIDFHGTNEAAPVEVKEVIKETAKAPMLKELPEYKPDMTEAQCIEALGLISKAAGKFTVHEKLQAMIDFTRKAWKLNNAEVSKVLSVMLSKLQNPKCFAFTCYSNIAYGGVTAHISPFITHTVIRDKLKDYGYTESQIAEIVRFFVTLQTTNNCKEGGESELQKRLKEVTSLLSVFDKTLITKIIAAWEKKKNIEIPKVTGWSYGKKDFDVAKVIEAIKTSYGNLGKKDLIDKLVELANLYKKEFTPIEA